MNRIVGPSLPLLIAVSFLLACEESEGDRTRADGSVEDGSVEHEDAGSEPVCDGVRDCQEGDDEQSCPEPFACSGGLFVRASARCDAKADCPQGDDESGCPALAPSGAAGPFLAP